MRHRLFGLVTLVALAAAANTTWAEAWDFNASGRNSRFSWSSIHSTTPGLLGRTEAEGMGSPLVTTNGVFFNNSYPADPMDFVVNAANPQKIADERWVMSTAPKAPVSAGQALNVDGSDPAGAPPIPFVRVFEMGTYESDDPIADFDLAPSIFITVFDPFAFIPSTPLSVTFYPDGTWLAKAEIDLVAATFGAGVTTMQIDLINDLRLRVGAASTASITKTSSLIIIPEPMTIGLVMLASPVVLLRRRR